MEDQSHTEVSLQEPARKPLLSAKKSRIQFLHEQYSQRVFDHHRRNGVEDRFADDAAPETADDLFAYFRSFDPTRNGSCLQWLLRTYLDVRLKTEDLPRIRETLVQFQRYKALLPTARRDLNGYATEQDVWKAVEPFVAQNVAASSREEERREREAVLAESEILLDIDATNRSDVSGKLVVAIPLTERAAKWWGRGTRWCTAAKNHNMFNHYSKSGPLVVIIAPDGSKFQFHAPSAQLMDAEDRPAITSEVMRSCGVLEERLPALVLSISRMQRQDYDDLVYLADDQFDDWHIDQPSTALYEEAVSRYGLPLDAVKDRYLSRAIFEEALEKSDRWFGKRIPDAYQEAWCVGGKHHAMATETEEWHRRNRIVSRNPEALVYLAEEMKTRGLCLAALRAAVRGDDDDIESVEAVLHGVPPSICDADMACFAMTATGGACFPIIRSRFPRIAGEQAVLNLAERFGVEIAPAPMPAQPSEEPPTGFRASLRRAVAALSGVLSKREEPGIVEETIMERNFEPSSFGTSVVSLRVIKPRNERSSDMWKSGTAWNDLRDKIVVSVVRGHNPRPMQPRRMNENLLYVIDPVQGKMFRGDGTPSDRTEKVLVADLVAKKEPGLLAMIIADDTSLHDELKAWHYEEACKRFGFPISAIPADMIGKAFAEAVFWRDPEAAREHLPHGLLAEAETILEFCRRRDVDRESDLEERRPTLS